jgi:flagellar basal-body rod protein FlgG
MIQGLFTASTAMDGFQTLMDTTSNNMANVSTTAFKRSVVGFEDLSYIGPDNLQVGQGVRVGSISPRGFAQGSLVQTGRNLDVAINGTGFFVVQVSDGTTRYTRDGSLQVDPQGRLVTTAGNIVQPPITIPLNATSTTIAADGTVSVITSASPTPKVLGQIQLAQFPNQEGLMMLAGNLYSETSASGPPTVSNPNSNGLGTLKQGSLEQSNVDVPTELLNLVTAQQGYNANSRVVGTTTQMMSSALNMIQ